MLVSTKKKKNKFRTGAILLLRLEGALSCLVFLLSPNSSNSCSIIHKNVSVIKTGNNPIVELDTCSEETDLFTY